MNVQEAMQNLAWQAVNGATERERGAARRAGRALGRRVREAARRRAQAEARIEETEPAPNPAAQPGVSYVGRLGSLLMIVLAVLLVASAVVRAFGGAL